MKNVYTKWMAMTIMLVALLGISSASFAQESGRNDVWKYSHFTSETEYLQHLNGTRYGGHFTETLPPSGNVRFPAEFEPMQGVIIAYSDDGFGLPTDMIVSITESCKVYVLVSSSAQKYANRELQNAGADMDNVVYWNMDVDSYWARDFGPWYIFNDNEPAIVDFVYNRNRVNDDDAPINIAGLQDLPLYGMNLIHTGGNMMQDGRGVGVSDELVYNENYEEGSDHHGSGNSATPQLNLHYSHEQINAIMKSYLNIEPYHVTADPLGQYIAHVDCWGKFLAPDKIIIARMPQNDAHYQDYEDVANYFATTNCYYGYPYKVYRVDELSSASNGTLAPYTNSLILNDKVYVPLGANSTYNANALAVYEEAMPGYTIIGVNSGFNAWLNSDAIHCRARGMMDFDMLFVDHREVIYGDEVEYQSAYAVEADIIAYSGAAITEANLVYRINDGAWRTVSMTATTGNTYAASLTGANYLDEVEYYITATDAAGNTGKQPIMGALDPHSFTIADNPAGYLNFTADVTTIPFHSSIGFQYTGTIPNVASFVWQFEGSTTASVDGPEMTVAYEIPGVYDVTLTVTTYDDQTYTLTKEDYITVTNHVYMQDGAITICDAIFCDDGGAEGNYMDNQNKVFTIYPCAGEHIYVKADFTSFDTESGYDKLSIYDGSRVSSATLIGTYSGSHGPGEIVATNAEGALTFKFVSDRVNNYDGWTATISCVQDPSYTIAIDDNIENGTIAVEDNTVFAGDVINVIVTPDEDYQLDRLYYVGSNNEEYDIDLYAHSFRMPACDIVLYAEFESMGGQTIVNMCNGSCSTSNTLFYDSGGANASYHASENFVYTFYPKLDNEYDLGAIRVDFNSFNTESRYDVLYVYDGENVNARLIGSFSGTRNPGTFVASNEAGALTFRFSSDRSVNRAGWEALVSTVVYKQYLVEIDEVEGGVITADYETALAGTVITLTATPSDEDHFFAGWNVTDENNNVIAVVNNQFEMPESDVVVSGRFAEGEFVPAHYELVTDIYDLEAGVTCLLVNGNDGLAYAMGRQRVTSTGSGFTYYYKYYREPVAVEITDGCIPLTEGAVEFVMGENAVYFNFYDAVEDGYLYCCRSLQANGRYDYYLNTVKNTNNKDWRITMSSDGAVEIQNMSYYRDMGFSQSRFDVYTLSEGKRLYIFKKVEGYWVENRGALSVAEQESDVNLYPNPTTDNVTINASGMSHISVFTLSGQMVYDMDVNADQEIINMSQFGAGMFLVRIVSNEGVTVKRVSVTR